MEELYPEYINNMSYRYIELDDTLISSFTIHDYPKYIKFLEFMKDIPKSIDYDFSMYIKKQNTKKVLKEITFNLASEKSELKTINSNQIDIDVINKTKDDAIKMRHEIQINNEEIYSIYAYFTLYFSSMFQKEIVKNILKNFESKLYSKQIIAYASNFRNIQTYIATLPLFNLSKTLSNENYKNFTTTNLAYFFPFYSTNIIDDAGAIFGNNIDNNSINIIDIFNSKYSNSNMCGFGSSGSGKTFFIKLHIIRQYFLNKTQYIFDPESEYIKLAENLDGEYINFNNQENHNYNIMEFFDFELNEEGFLKNKILSIITFISDFIFLSDYQKQILSDCINKAYFLKDITSDIESVYVQFNEQISINKVIKVKENVPTFKDVYNEIEKYLNKNIKILKSKKDEIIDLKNKLYTNILTKCNFLCNTSNIDISKKLIVFNISNIKNENAAKIIKYFLTAIEQNLKYKKNIKNSNEKKTIIYIDEIWKYIGVSSNYELSQNIFKMYKTIRKLNASIITITQDILDFFEYNNGIYGKSILNNSFFKVFFKLNFSNAETLKKIGIISKNNNDIYKLAKGQAQVCFGNNNVILNINASNFENKIIEGEEYENNSCN